MENEIRMLASAGGGQMNSFVIRTASGGLVVMDGGYRGDCADLLGCLREISGREKPRVDGWFLSHAHDDHIEAFLETVRSHADEVDIGKVYYCFPSEQFFQKNEPLEAHTISEFYGLLPRFASAASIVTRGDRYEIGGASFDILSSPDPSFTHNAINNSTVVIRMALGGKTFLFLGDLGVAGGRKLLAEYGSALKSDFCQMAHHGQSGVERSVYEAVAPEACLWCTPLWLWNNDAGKGYNTHGWKTIEVRGWMDALGVKKHFVTKDGTQTIRF